MALKVPKKSAASLLKELGLVNAPRMPASALQTALRKIDETFDDAARAKVQNPDNVRLLNRVLVTITAASNVDVIDDKPPTSGPPKKPEPPRKYVPGQPQPRKQAPDAKTGPPAKTPPQSKPEAAPASARPKQEKAPVATARPAGAKPGATAQKAQAPVDMPRNGKNGRPGVYKVMVDVLKKASAKRPVTLDAVLDELREKCTTVDGKQRNPDGMMVTLRDAIRRTLKKRYNIVVRTDGEGGYWIDPLLRKE